jgi:murein DD-endopeptidase MepM/ murein hydrolase activator NlpD
MKGIRVHLSSLGKKCFVFCKKTLAFLNPRILWVQLFFRSSGQGKSLFSFEKQAFPSPRMTTNGEWLQKLFLMFLLANAGSAFAETPLKQVVVGSEDTVYQIAYNYGISTHALIAANNLHQPYVLTEGQVLVIPSPNEHIVGKGENLQTIAESHGVKVDVLAQENNTQFVKPGDRLTIPPRDTESLAEALKPPVEEIKTSSLEPLPLVGVASSPISLKPQETSKASAPHSPLPNDLAEELAREKRIKSADTSLPVMGNLAERKPGAPHNPPLLASQEDKSEEKKPKKEVKLEKKKLETKEENNKAKKTKEEEKEIKDPLFMWPVEGKVIGKFGAGGKNDGINIKVPEGTSVKAAADGDVMYAGNELKGFGHLLLLKHSDGWMTAYAHNSELLVKKGAFVKQGQAIAKSGKTGDVKEAQLHFELRKGKQPVDPLPKLK